MQCLRHCIIMTPKEIVVVLRPRNRYVFIFSLFVTYFVHNVSDVVSYDRKELLDIRAAINHLVLEELFNVPE